MPVGHSNRIYFVGLNYEHILAVCPAAVLWRGKQTIFSLCQLKPSPRDLQPHDTRPVREVISHTAVLYLLAVWLNVHILKCYFVYLPVPNATEHAR